jgi:predicted methyltransferase
MAAFKIVLAAGAAALLMGGAALAQPNVHDPKPSAVVLAAVADAGRPAADTARDENRKPAQVVAVSGLKSGDTVAELGSAGGYYSRILSKVVGPKGKVIAVVNGPGLVARPTSADAIKAIAATDPTITVVPDDYATFAALAAMPKKVDMVFTTDNYHDFHNAMSDMAPFDKAVFNALRPGGIFFIEDHASAPGAGLTVTRTLHRIDPAVVLAEVTAAGFKLIRTSDILAHPEDDHLKQNAETSIRGHTDRFIMVFQKP